MEEKYGQFYLLAAVIIISVIIGFAVVGNYFVRKSEPVRVFDLSKELNLEAGKVIDHTLYNPGERTPSEIIKDFVTKYSGTYLSGPGQSVIFVFGSVIGSTINLEAVKVEQGVTGVVGVTFQSGSGGSGITVTQLKATNTPVFIEGNKLQIEFDNIIYTFDLQQGQNFYFVISEESERGTEVTTG
jgi:hypothetical protein